MSSVPDPLPRRTRRRSTPATAGPRCSCDLLLELVGVPEVKDLIALHRIDPGGLTGAREALHAAIEPEPADWRLRLQQRGATSGGTTALERFLGLVRSADCHAYQLLEHLGADNAALRRLTIDRIREFGVRTLRASSPVPAANSRPEGRPERRRPTAAPEAEPRSAPVAEVTRPVPEPEPTVVPRTEVAPSSSPAPIDPRTLGALVGRDRELRQLADAVSRAGSRPALLVGAHGSGRSLLARHLAIALERPVFALDAADEDEAALRATLQEVAARGGVAVFDDLDRVPLESVPPVLRALTRTWGTTPALVAVVSHETRARLEAWLPGLLASVDELVLEPLPSSAVHEAVRGRAGALLADHGLGLAPAANLADLVRLADRYLGGLAMPARALDLLDLACARARREGASLLGADTWIEIVAERSGVPRERIQSGSDRSLLELEQALGRRVVGHAEVLGTLSALIRRNRAGFDSHRPVVSTLLLGQSGVGKTEIAKALAETLFDRADALVRLDMSEYSESHAVARIVGAPPGYVGHELGGALTDPLLQRRHCVVLLDEIEKAHRDVHQLLLQVLDEGRLTDGRGRTIDFHHAVVVMTSNLGSELRDGAAASPAEVLRAARAAFPVELWNRIDAPLVLRPLTDPEMTRICQRLAQGSSDRLFAERGIRFTLGPGAARHLVELAGRDPALGARPLRHLLTREVESRVAEAILGGRLRPGDQAQVRVEAGGLTVARAEPKAAR